MAAVKETDEDISEKREKLEQNPLPTTAALHQLVPVEKANKRKASADSDCQVVAVPNVGFKGTKANDKVKTKHMMLGLQVSLNKLLGFRWSDTAPENPLRPLQPGEVREVYKKPSGETMIYYHTPETGEVIWQSTQTSVFTKHMRMTSVMDEGSSNYALFAALAEHCAVLPLRDSMHKMARVQDLAFASHEALVEFKREIFVCLKLDRAPYSTSRFGRRLKEGALDYASTMDVENDPLLQPLLHSIAADIGVSADDLDSIRASILGFANRESKGMSNDYSMGRWESFFDGGRILLRHQ